MKHSFLYVLILVVAMSACNNKESIPEEHTHDHGEIKLQFTAYTEQFELFAETDPFVKGQDVEILAHFTKIEDFKPLVEGEITAKLISGEKEVKQTVSEYHKPGIYEFILKPEKNGASQLIFEIKTNNSTYEIKIDDIVVYNDEHTAAHITEKKHKEYLNTIPFTKEQSWKIDFKTQFPDFTSFGKIIKTSAHVYSNPDNEYIVTAKTNGIVHFINKIFDGTKVNAGDAILSISANGLANDNANVRYLEAKNNYEQTRSDFERKTALAQKQIISEKELENSKREFENAKAIFENLKKNFNTDGQMVSAKHKGYIKHVHINNGQYVEAGEPLFSIISNDNLVVKAEVQQKYYSCLNSIESANFKSIITDKVFSLEELNGKVLAVGKSIDNETGYLVPVNFQISNDEYFLPGSYIEVFIKTKSDKKSLLVPNSALIEEQGNYYVFVQINPELFEKREVKLGKTDGINTEILSGLNRDERIVSHGAVIVKLAAVSNSLDPHAGHVH